MPSESLFAFAVSLLAIFATWSYFKAYRSPLHAIPTIGYSGILTSYISAIKFYFCASEIVQEGYNKHRGGIFKLPNLSKWIVVVSGRQLVDDIKKATDAQLSFREAIAEQLQTDYTIGSQIRRDPYHVGIVRTVLTRNLGMQFFDIRDEISSAFGDFIPTKSNEWLTIPAYKTVVHIVCRTSNRLFVGLPLCRDGDYRSLNERFTFDVVKGAKLINMFPAALRPIIGRFLINVPENIDRAVRHLGPIIQDRITKEQQYGTSDWPGKPNDMISWLLEGAQDSKRRDIRELTIRILTVNFAAIHTTSMAFTHLLYDLATHTEYMAPLREEVESIIEQEGWSKASVDKMRKLDSFLKESQRLHVAAALLMTRKVLKDFTFSNGVVVPAGATVSVASYALHRDENIYSNPYEFDGFRFYNMREGSAESVKHSMVSLDLEYLTFGNGRHACAGRFFAVNELKTMLAHVLLNYDVKIPGDGKRPPDFWFGESVMPNRTASVQFRRRQ